MNTLIETTPERITQYYREGTSDKVYQVSLEPAGELFVVNFAYGRRGSTLNTGTKTASPVDYATARKTYDRLVREKTAKGYTPGPDGTPFQNTAKADRFTGILPQLLNPVDEGQVQRLLNDADFGMQEKFDGRRVLLQKTGSEILPINRKGLVIGLFSSIIRSAEFIPGDYLLDGECVGDVFYAFDLLERDGEDLRLLPCQRRLFELAGLLSDIEHPHIELVPTAYQPEEKQRLFDELRQANREGVVFKRLDAPYTPGRPNSGGPALKHKFCATLSAVVAHLNARRSVEIRLLGKDGWQVAGNVTIPANESLPKVGEVVEVRYLHAFAQSGVLYQPVYLGKRSDIEPADCLAGQLKFKPSEEDES
jgi:bifunctional non-homologous end joining protein LigD